MKIDLGFHPKSSVKNMMNNIAVDDHADGQTLRPTLAESLLNVTNCFSSR